MISQYSPSERSLDCIYRLPRDTASLEDWERWRHLDLPERDDLALDAEAFRVAHRLAYEADARRRGWLVERRDAIRMEQAARRGNFAASHALGGASAAKFPRTNEIPSQRLRVPSGAAIVPIRGGGRRDGR